MKRYIILKYSLNQKIILFEIDNSFDNLISQNTIQFEIDNLFSQKKQYNSKLTLTIHF